MSFPTVRTGVAVEGVFMRDPQVCLGSAFAFASYQFFLTGTTTPANVYQDGNLTTPFSPTGLVGADAAGRFPPIYLDTSVTYAVQLSGNGSVRLTDPYVPLLATNGVSQLSAVGPTIAPTGEITIPAPSGGNASMRVIAPAGGGIALKISTPQPGTSTLTINNSVTTGAQTATFSATNKPGTATSSPAGWLQLVCDGVLYYTPIWHGNNFTPYVANPSALGEVIIGATATFNGNGTTTVTGAGSSATPSSWFVPTQTGLGANYWVQITRTAPSNRPGLVFNIGGTSTNITSGGLLINANGSAQLNGTYVLLVGSSSGTQVASGTIQLAGGNGVQDAIDYNGPSPLFLGGDGTATVNSAANSNWFKPTTASTGSGFWINITRTSNSSGTTFTNADGVWANITNSGLTIDISGGSGNLFANGNWAISNTNSSAGIIALGTIELTKAANVQSPNWSGTTPLVLKGDGTATLNGAATSAWYVPTTSGIGASYWIDITRTSGTSGVNFSAAQGSFTNISSGGLTIGMSGTSGNVGTVTVNGSWQISSSSGGSPVLGSGTVSLSLSGLTIIHIYTTQVTNATETIPPGSTTAQGEVWGSGGGGQGHLSDNLKGAGGGAGGFAYRSISVSGQAGHTFKYTIGAVGNGGVGTAVAGTAGNAGSITAGTVTGWTTLTANGGQGGNGTGGAGGTASGGTTNTTGGAGGNSQDAGGNGAGGSAVGSGISGDMGPYGAGGAGGTATGNGHAGSLGAAVFFYS